MRDQTPLYSALLQEAEQKKLRMHMPGHKGKPFPGFAPEQAFCIDYTELKQTGNLYEGLPPILNAEERMAEVYSAKDGFFLTGGATQGIFAAMAVACPPGSRVLIDRGSHRAVWSAMIHLGLDPEYIYPKRLEPWSVAAPIDPEAVEAQLSRFPKVSAVVMTSPTYYGVITEIEHIAEITQKYGVPLIVDAAHGAHFPYLGMRTAVQQGADLAVFSAHKTLPVFGSGALLFSSGRFDPAEIRRRASLFGTSSPSYLVMAAMDAARAYLEGVGGIRYRTIQHKVQALRKTLQRQGRFLPLEDNEEYTCDPTRLTVNTSESGLAGYEAAEMMETEYGIVPEMSDLRNVVLIPTCADEPEELGRVERAFLEMGLRTSGMPLVQSANDLPSPVKLLLPREAAYAKHRICPFTEAVGRIAAEPLSLYPPGIPVVAAGEKILPEQMEYLRANRFDRPVAVIE